MGLIGKKRETNKNGLNLVCDEQQVGEEEQMHLIDVLRKDVLVQLALE